MNAFATGQQEAFAGDSLNIFHSRNVCLIIQPIQCSASLICVRIGEEQFLNQRL